MASAAQGLQQIRARRDGKRAGLGQMQVTHRRADVAVAQQALDGAQIDPGFQQMGGEGMAQAVDADFLGDTGAIARGVEPFLGLAGIDGHIGMALREQPDLGPIGAPVKAALYEIQWVARS